MEFRVDLATFRGPLDLLLYLVRKHEVEIVDIPIAPITAQFLAYLQVLRALDMSAVGEFVDMASTLLEIKSRMVLPHGGEESEELPDPRHELVERLLEYKKFKDAASMLEEQGRSWRQRFARRANDAAVGPRDLAKEELQEVELWDLVSAFGRIMRDRQALAPATIVYDDTPIHVHMARIQELLAERGRLALSELFEPGLHKSRLVGIFLAALELVRHQRVRAEQTELFGEVWIVPGLDATKPLDISTVDNYEAGGAKQAGGS
jgi:segregation and condensation protein A